MFKVVTLRQNFLFGQRLNHLFPLITIVLLLFSNPRKRMSTATKGKSMDVTIGVESGLINLHLGKNAK